MGFTVLIREVLGNFEAQKNSEGIPNPAFKIHHHSPLRSCARELRGGGKTMDARVHLAFVLVPLLLYNQDSLMFSGFGQ